MPRLFSPAFCVALLCCALCATRAAVAAEHVQLRNGFSMDCDHHEAAPNGRVHLVLDATSSMDVEAAAIVSVEPIAAGWALKQGAAATHAGISPVTPVVVPHASMDALIASAGATRNINIDLLQSVIHAESGGHVRAVSRTGAQGLMQLMPATAHAMGVIDSFTPEDNLRGGTAYLDGLLTRYHNDLVLALAAYNAGPAAVDRYHGVPPYRETVAYVSRIVREFNRRTLALQRASADHAQPALLTGAGLP